MASVAAHFNSQAAANSISAVAQKEAGLLLAVCGRCAHAGCAKRASYVGGGRFEVTAMVTDVIQPDRQSKRVNWDSVTCWSEECSA